MVVLTPPDLKRKRQGNYCTLGFVHNLAVNGKKILFFVFNFAFPLRRKTQRGDCNRGTAGFAYVGGACVVNKRLEKVIDTFFYSPYFDRCALFFFFFDRCALATR